MGMVKMSMHMKTCIVSMSICKTIMHMRVVKRSTVIVADTVSLSSNVTAFRFRANTHEV